MHLRANNVFTHMGIAIFKYLPYVLIVVLLKLFLLMVLLSNNGDNNYVYYNDYNPGIEDLSFDIDKLQDDTKLEESHRVLDHLNDTVLVASDTNRTPHDTIWMFFNRIPRTGGHTIIGLLKELGEYHDYKHQEHSYRTPWQRLFTEEEKKNLATWFEYNLSPKSYDRLAPFIDFTKYRSKYVHTRPAYVTIVRDPVEKFMSNFRFRRFDQETAKKQMDKLERNKTGQGRKWYRRTIDECVLEADHECNLINGQPHFVSSVAFLCGQDEQCLNFNDRWALQKAKYNAEFQYSVVGVLENWNTTLNVLEQYVPMFFKGAFNKYWDQDFADHRQEKQNPKIFKPMSDKVRQKLKNLLSTEYELYEFLTQRLHRQYNSMADKMKSTTILPRRKTTPRQLSPLDRFEIEFNKIGR